MRKRQKKKNQKSILKRWKECVAWVADAEEEYWKWAEEHDDPPLITGHLIKLFSVFAEDIHEQGARAEAFAVEGVENSRIVLK